MSSEASSSLILAYICIFSFHSARFRFSFSLFHLFFTLLFCSGLHLLLYFAMAKSIMRDELQPNWHFSATKMHFDIKFGLEIRIGHDNTLFRLFFTFHAPIFTFCNSSFKMAFLQYKTPIKIFSAMNIGLDNSVATNIYEPNIVAAQ